MSSSSFRSASRRASAVGAAEDAGSSTRDRSHHRRSRSLSRFSGRFPPPPPSDADEHPTPRGRFVNKVRGSGFPEISLDDLADEFFRARVESDEESEASAGKSSSGRDVGRRSSGSRYWMETESSRQRGRSVSRAPSDQGAVQGKVGSDGGANGRRRRSVSVAPRRRCSDSENDTDSQSSGTLIKSTTFVNGKVQQPSSNKPKTSGTALRRSISQKNLIQPQDIFSSPYSSVTDDEAKDSHLSKCGTERTIQAVYAQEKAEHPMGDGEGIELYEAMRKEVRYAVQDLRMELEKVIVKTDPLSIVTDNDVQPKSSHVLEAIAEIRRSYTSKLEQSEKRKKDLLAELAVEEERGQELSKIVKELLPSPKKSVGRERQPKSRRRSNDRTRISKCLTEEAEMYFQDFLSNVEDTDISSFDGERSDTSSSLRDRGSNNPIAGGSNNPITDTYGGNMTKTASQPVDEDVLLPWLQWETSPDPSSSCKTKTVVPLASSSSMQETNGSPATSSLASWSPQHNNSSLPKFCKKINFAVASQPSSSVVKKGSSFDMDEYLNLMHNEDLLFEMFRNKPKIDSGSMILCGSLMI